MCNFYKIVIKSICGRPVILQEILSQKKTTFAISEIKPLLDKIGIQKVLKSASGIKGDIDFKINYQNLESNFLFTIKSFFANKPTLVNASTHTNFTFKLNGIIQKEWQDLKSKGLVKNIPLENMIFDKMDSSIYDKNLRLIDLSMPEILSYGLLEFFSSSKSKIKDIVEIIVDKNPLAILYPDIYIEKFKDFLFYSATGIFPSKEWHGKSDVDGGAIIVQSTGDMVTFFIVKKQSLSDFRDYLYNVAFFEVASPSRHKFGRLYQEDNQTYLKLNLQVRLK